MTSQTKSAAPEAVVDHKHLHIFTTLEKILIVVFSILLVLSFHYHEEILLITKNFRAAPIDAIMLFITNKGFAVLLIALAVTILWRKKGSETALIIFSIAAGLGLSYLLKKVIQAPRPYAQPHLADIALTGAWGYTFPSLHATVCLSIIPFLKGILKNKWLHWGVTALLLVIVASRTYLGVHYLEDIIAGGLIGYITARICLSLQDKYHIVQLILHHFKDHLELRRQLAHMATGTAILLLLKVGLLNSLILSILLACGGILSLIVRNVKIPYIHKYLLYFERDSDLQSFPGKGAFFFVLGCTLALIFFEINIAMASIAVMTYGDAITTLAGKYFGRIKNPFNPQKHLEGTVLAIIVSTVITFSFIDFPRAFLGSAAGMIFESFTIRFIDRVIDDNVLIPIVAGIVMTAIRY